MRCWSSYLLILWIVLCETLVLQSNQKDAYPMLSLHEYDFLKDLYQKTNGPYWTMKDNWDFSNATLHNPCIEEWYGIMPAFSTPELCFVAFIDLSFNNLTGTLPTKIENFPKLTQFRVDSNKIYGRLPLFMNTPRLTSLLFEKNHFSGSIPSNMIDDPVRSQFSTLDLSRNSLTGTLPDSIYLVNWWTLNLGDNHLSGTLSSNLTKLTSVRYLDLSNNHFHGSIISSFESFSHLMIFNVMNNFFSGTLSCEMKGSGSSRLTVKMDGNNLEGPLPQQFSSNIDRLYLSSNYLTGTVSSLICNVQKLKVLILSDNQLRGTIPSCLWGMSMLNIDLDYNLFHGSIDSSTIKAPWLISFVSIGFNQFTGTFPVTWFYQKNLLGVAASNNCFQGGFKNLDCNNVSERISYLFLDSLFSPSNCNNNYNRWNSFGGSFPICLLSKTGLISASLIGNGFTGALPSDAFTTWHGAATLNLSRNLLTGTLPESLSNLTWIELDLSYNKLHGTIPPLNSSYSLPTSLALSNNRFTSSLDFPLFDVIDITRGNLLTLKKDNRVYSESLGITINRQISSFLFYYLILFLLFLFVAFILIYRLFKPFYLRDIIHSLLNPDKKNFIDCIIVCLFLSCFLLPSYCFFHSSTFNMIDEDKVWRFSSLYLRGVMPCAVIVCFIIVTNIVLLSRCLPKKLDSIHRQINSSRQTDSILMYGLYFLTFLLNISASVAVSALYVRILKDPVNERAGSSFRVFLLQIGLGWFYLLWNRYVLRLAVYHLKKISSETISPSWHYEYELMLWLSSSVLIPLFFMLLKDESCFEGLFFRRTETNQIIGEADCHFVSVYNDYKFCHRRTSYEIPFLYYNQCGLKLLQTYLPVWVYYYASISLLDLIALFFAMSCYGRQNTFVRYLVLENARDKDTTEHLFDLAMLLSFGVQYPLLAIITVIKVLTQHLLLVLCKNEVVVSSWDSLPVSEIELQERPQVEENEDDHDGTNSSQHGLMEDQLTPSSGITETLTSGQQYSWLIFYTSITFNSIILFDIIADDQGSKIGIYLLLGLLVFTLIIRLFFHYHIGRCFDCKGM